MRTQEIESERSFWQKTLHWLAILSMVVMPLALSACNTMEGAGEDIEEAGESVQDAAE